MNLFRISVPVKQFISQQQQFLSKKQNLAQNFFCIQEAKANLICLFLTMVCKIMVAKFNKGQLHGNSYIVVLTKLTNWCLLLFFLLTLSVCEYEFNLPIGWSYSIKSYV